MKGRREDDLNSEIEFHLEQHVRDLMAPGMSEEEARGIARKSFGNISNVKEDVRQVWGWMWVDRLAHDLRYAVRGLLRAPAFTAVAVLTMAIGIGASTAIFSQVNAVFFKAVPARDPEELRTLSWTSQKRAFAATAQGRELEERLAAGETISEFSYAGYTHMRDTASHFAGLACWQDPGENFPVILNEWGRVQAHLVSSNYFEVLGTVPALGRTFTAADDHAGKTDMLAVVSWGLWQRAFNGDAGVLNRPVKVNGTTYVIAGVLPRDFVGLDMLFAPEVVIPITTMDIGINLNNKQDWRACNVVGRLRPGVSDEQARAQLETSVAQAILADPPKEEYKLPHVRLENAGRGNKAVRGTVRGILSRSLLLVFAIAGIIFLIACNNIAGLLLARGVFREKEIATRLALGAARSRVIRQLITESLLLSFAGGTVGIAHAYLLSGLLPSVQSQVVSGALGAFHDIAIDGAVDLHVLAFGLFLMIVAGLFFGLMPAFRASRVDLLPMMQSQGRKPGHWRAGFVNGKAFVTAQVALSLVLLIGAGLFIRTVLKMRSEPLGYDPTGILLFRIEPRLSGYARERRLDFFETALNRLNTLPGVTSASGSVIPLIGNVNGSAAICVPGYTPANAADSAAAFSSVAPRFFETMRLPLRAGKDVEWSNREGTPYVVLINEAFARKYYAGRDPIGQQIGGPGCPGNSPPRTVIGVVADSKQQVRAEARPTFFPAYRQQPTNIWMTIVVRTTGEPSQMIPVIRRAIADLDPSVPILDAIELTELRDRLITRERLLAGLLVSFGIVGILLASIGIYGMLAYTVNWRTPEIGVRMALGARRGDIIRMVIQESIVSVAVGIAIGLTAALALTRLIETLLFAVSPNDPWTLAAATMIFVAAATLGAFLPALRASRINPMRALRYE